MREKVKCEKDNKIHSADEPACSCWRPMHPAVAQAREEWRQTWKEFCKDLQQYKDNIIDNEIFTVTVNKLLKITEDLHLRRYLHKSGRFSE